MNYDLGRRDVLAIAVLVGPLMTLKSSPAPASVADQKQGQGFDFLHGRWTVRHRQLRHRLAGDHEWFEFPGTLDVQPILGGMGNFDRNELYHPKGYYEAHSLRLFNPTSGPWSIFWLDSRAPNIEAPVTGGFEGRKGHFFSDDTLNEKPIRVRTTYEPLSATTAQWTQAFSNDGEAHWETNWIMDFTRARA